MTRSNTHSILIFGAGNMGRSIAAGLQNQGWNSNLMTFIDHSNERFVQLKQQFADSSFITHLSELVTLPDIVLLAVKPNDMKAVCRQLAERSFPPSTLFISIAAGVPVQALHSWLGADAVVIRCMPNTPAAIGLGMTGLYHDATLSSSHKSLAEDIMGAVGKTLWVDSESMLDAVTALSGSGPAYLFYLMECLQQGGQALGLDPRDSYALTLHTVLGAAQLALQRHEEFSTLRANVTSKGGTTEQAIQCFEKHNLKHTITSAVEAAAHKASEISHSFTKE